LYGNAGYTVPQVVFWNINSHDNVPSKFNEQGVALVSGFSPAIVKSILTAKNVSPVDIMMDAIGIEKYDPTLTVPLSRPQAYEEIDGKYVPLGPWMPTIFADPVKPKAKPRSKAKIKKAKTKLKAKLLTKVKRKAAAVKTKKKVVRKK
jgi:hypothetical protein